MILQTKLFRPITPKTHSVRNALEQQLQDALTHRLNIIAAPAGYGKSSLVASWLAQNPTIRSCWLSLDNRDNDPKQFWLYVIAALQTVDPELGKSAEQALQLPQVGRIEDVLQAVINDLVIAYQQNQHQIILVLDDYHLIKSVEIQQTLDFWIENVPSTLIHMVITARHQPPLNLTRLRARQQLFEMPMTDLQYTIDELTDLLNKQQGFTFTHDDIAQIWQKTEGWLVAIQLIIVTLQNQSKNEAQKRQFLTDLIQSNHYITDYLIEEIVARLSPDIRQFLEKTVFLIELSEDLLQQLFPQIDTSAILKQLRSQNLFLIPLDATYTRLRYHHLFAEIVQKHSTLSIEQRHALQQQASDWHANQREWPLAIEYAQKIEDYDRVAKNILTIFKLKPTPQSIHLSWFKNLPEAIYQQKPELRLTQVLLLSTLDKESALSEAKELIQASPGQLDDPFWQAIWHYCQALIYWNRQGHQYNNGGHGNTQSINHCQRALDLLGDNSPLLTGYILLLMSCLNESDLNKALHFALRTVDVAQKVQDDYLQLAALSAIWETKLENTNANVLLKEIEQWIIQSPIVKRQHPSVAIAYLHRGLYYLQLGMTKNAQESFQEALRFPAIKSYFGNQVHLRIGLSRSLGLTGRNKGAIDELDFIEDNFSLYKQIINILRYWTKLWQYSEQTIAADLDHWASNNDVFAFKSDLSQIEGALYHIYSLIIYGCLGLFNEDKDILTRVCDKIASILHTSSDILRTRHLLWLMSSYAIFLDGLGKNDEAYSFTRSVLIKSQNHGDRFSFTRMRHLGLKLLNQLTNEPDVGDWAMSIIKQILVDQKHRQQSAGESITPQIGYVNNTLIEPLTNREYEILLLITEGKSNKEIATQLHLSPNTIRVYASNIYGKLNVSSRTQATHKARVLGIVSS